MNRRELMAGTAASLAIASGSAQAQGANEIVIGAIYPMSGSSAQVGADAKLAFDTAVEIINNAQNIDIPTAKSAGLAGLGGAKVRIIMADHQADPQKGRAEAERLITQEKVAAIIGAFHSSVSATASASCERYGVPYLAADSSSPTLQTRGLKFFFRAAAHDVMFSDAMFDFMDAQKKAGQKIETIALFHEDTIFGTDSANAQMKLAAARGYKIVADIKYKANSPSLTSEIQQIKSADPDVVMPSSYTTDAILMVKTMAEFGYKPKNMIAQAAGFSEKTVFDTVGDKLGGLISRASFSVDMAATRKSVEIVNGMFKAKANKDLNDNTARQLMGLIVLADAIDRAKATDGQKIRDALAATDIPGDKTIMPWARVKFDETGQNQDATPVLIQYVGGKFVTIYPSAVAVAKPMWPMNG